MHFELYFCLYACFFGCCCCYSAHALFTEIMHTYIVSVCLCFLCSFKNIVNFLGRLFIKMLVHRFVYAHHKICFLSLLLLLLLLLLARLHSYGFVNSLAKHSTTFVSFSLFLMCSVFFLFYCLL